MAEPQVPGDTLAQAVFDGRIKLDDAVQKYRPPTIGESTGSFFETLAQSAHDAMIHGDAAALRMMGKAAQGAMMSQTMPTGDMGIRASNLLNGWADSIEKYGGKVHEQLAPDEHMANAGVIGQASQEVAGGVGSLAGMAALPVPGGPMTSGAIRMGLVSAGQGYYEAEARGASDDQKWENFVGNGLIGGAAGAVPGVAVGKIGALLARADKASGGGLSNMLWDGVKSGFSTGSASMLQQAGSNIVAMHTGDEDRAAMEGVLRAGAGGALTGLLVGALAAPRGGESGDLQARISNEVRPPAEGATSDATGTPEPGVEASAGAAQPGGEAVPVSVAETQATEPKADETQPSTKNTEQGDRQAPPQSTEQPSIRSGADHAAEPESLGIAHRVAEARGIEAERGEGISREDSVARGQELLKIGADPDNAIAHFEKTGAINADAMALVRARAHELERATDTAADEHGEESQQYDKAFQAASDWIEKVKPMQTEWHKIGQAQQGDSEINASSLHGLERAFHGETGKRFKPEQVAGAKAKAAIVRVAERAEAASKSKLYGAVDQFGVMGPKGREAIASRIAAIDKRLAEKLGEIGKQAGRARAGLDTDTMKLVAEYAGLHIKRAGLKFEDWARTMVEKFGPKVHDYLAPAWKRATDAHKADVMAHPPGTQMTSARARALWEYAKQNYIDRGVDDFDDIRHKLAMDFGMSVADVTRGLMQPKSARVLTNDMYVKQAARRRVINEAKGWVREQAKPGWQRFAEKVPRAFFTAKVAGHGTVGMVTHAGSQMFNPAQARTYWTNFGRQFKLLGLHDKGAYHEMVMADLQRDPNFVTARRAGLANDPTAQVGDYERDIITKGLGKLGFGGARGFDALKLFRQDMFNKQWDAMPESLKTPEMAQMTADSINHATGFVKAKMGGRVASAVLFAPKLEGSRWAFLLGDPAKAAKTFASWKTASPEAKHVAIAEVKQKALIAGTYISALAVNQALLKATDSDDDVNFTDPTKADWLSFKAAGHKVGVVSPMIGTVRYLVGLAREHESVPKMADRTAKYVRGKLSPFAQVATDIGTGTDYGGRPLPHSNKPVPGYLQRQGKGQYTWPEYAGEALLPIPAEEAVKEALGPDGSGLLNSVIVGAVGATGARVQKEQK